MARRRVGLDLHGAVGIELVDASPVDEAVVRRQLGPLPPLHRSPEITITFVDRLPARGPVTFIGLDDAGFDDDRFLVLRSRHKARTRIAMPLDRAGGTCQIVCERGAPGVPHLVAIVNLTALSNGLVPLHASAFEHEGVGVLVTGWAKGGKTETLLAFMARGASYVGDEWIYLSADGRMHGMPEPIKIWSWHLRELNRYRSVVPRKDRLRMRLLDRIAAAGRWTASGSPVRTSAAGRLAGRIAPFAANQAYVHLPPEKLFGANRCRNEASLDRIVFVVSNDSPETGVEHIAGTELSRRMIASNAHERLDFVAAWLKHRFAFPDRRNDVLERLESLEHEGLTQVFDRRSGLLLRHPYPVSIPTLYDALWPALHARSDGAEGGL
jgi:hypothetical protein